MARSRLCSRRCCPCGGGEAQGRQQNREGRVPRDAAHQLLGVAAEVRLFVADLDKQTE